MWLFQLRLIRLPVSSLRLLIAVAEASLCWCPEEPGRHRNHQGYYFLEHDPARQVQGLPQLVVSVG